MALSTHLDELYHLPAHDFPEPGATGEPPAADAVAWRISASEETEENWPETFARFCSTVDLTRVRALIVGQWGEAYESGPGDIIEALLAARGQLPALRALFLGDMVFTECEISWIQQTDVTALLTAFPELEEFGVRGGAGLGWQVPRHERLRSLVVQTGGLPASVVRGIGASELPALERLELWLGTTWYGADSTAADLEPILSGARLPRLRHLALRNSDIQDAVAAAVASAPVLARLDVLDLSMGTLGDDGATALLAGRPLTHLKKLDLHHHYIGAPLQDRLRDTLVPAGVALDLDEGNAEEDREDDGTVHRFVSVGE